MLVGGIQSINLNWIKIIEAFLDIEEIGYLSTTVHIPYYTIKT